jgi:hypothetical protein
MFNTLRIKAYIFVITDRSYSILDVNQILIFVSLVAKLENTAYILREIIPWNSFHLGKANIITTDFISCSARNWNLCRIRHRCEKH